MKTLYSFLVVCAILSIMNSCDGCCRTPPSDDTKPGSIVVNPPRADGIELSPNKLVVRFPENYPDSLKEQLKKDVWVIKDSIKKCSCGDSPVELWEIDTTKIDIEHATRSTASAQEDGEKSVEGDRQFSFGVPDPGSKTPSTAIIVDDEIEGGTRNILGDLTGATAGGGSTVNIVIVDTGLDFKDYEQKSDFLYDTSTTGMDCNSEYAHTSGWNFIDGNADISDSHSDGHGTFVTKTLMRELDSSDVSYSILPIKAFDGNGRGSYWDIVCAFNYIREIQEIKGNLHIVNASFGYVLPVVDGERNKDSVVSKYNKNGILGSLIAELENSTIIMASAGNDNLNTDEPENAHFPSGFTAPNLITVGGFTQTDYVKEPIFRSTKTIAGNYGPTSIDLASPYHMVFTEESQNKVSIRTGTSYGTPVATAKLAQFISNGTSDATSSQIISTFLASQFVKTLPDLEQKVGMGRYITSEYRYINTIPPIPVAGGGVVAEPEAQ